MKRRVAVRGIVVYDNKLLCVKLKAYDGKDATEFWATPGGGVEPGEALVSALSREMVEETGVKPAIGNLLYVQQFQWHGMEQMEFFFHIKNHEDYINIDLASTTHGATEIEIIDFIKPSGNNILPEFLQTESLTNLPAQQTKYFNYL